MEDIDNILQFAAELIHQKTQTYCSELQRRILISALQEERKTYDQLAEECGYSPKYVKQDVAPKLWQLLSQVLETKVSKANVRAALEQAIRQRSVATDAYLSIDPLATLGDSLGGYADTSESVDDKAAILLVDDQPQNLRLLSELLEEQGYVVQQAINGSVALQAVSQYKPDLVLLDIYMPNLDGYGVCQQIKASPETADIPVIFISALDEAWDKVKAFSAGGSDYITKPFKVVEVLARVENQLKIRQLQQVLKRQNLRLQQAIHELQRLAAIDELTQVASRRRFDDYLLKRWKMAASDQTRLTLMFVQLDYSFGPQMGGVDASSGASVGVSDGSTAQVNDEPEDVHSSDRILKSLAQLIQQSVQSPHWLVCRYGTLTFAVIIPHPANSPAPKPEQVANTVIDSANPLLQPTPMTLSIGLATVRPTTNAQIEQLLAAANCNLQQANAQGENRIVASAE